MLTIAWRPAVMTAFAFALISTRLAFAAPGPLVAGAAKVDVTPAINAVSPGATKSPILPVLSIRDKLFVRAIYFANGESCGALVSVDIGNARGLGPAADAAAAAIGCPRANVIVSATHSHSAGTKAAAGDTPADSMPDRPTVSAAVAKALIDARAKTQPARVGYGKTNLYLNVNKEVLSHGKWMEGVDPAGPSDKTLAVVGFIAADGTPIGVYLNYAAHPTNYYLTGILTADFPGDVTDYVERRYDNKTVAVFSQAASGDQSGIFQTPFLQLKGARRGESDRADDRIGQPEPWYKAAQKLNDNTEGVKALENPMPPSTSALYDKARGFNNELVHAYGVLMGEASIEALKNPDVAWQSEAVITGSSDAVACPGRDRVDLTARQGVLPPYKDGEPVTMQVTALRIGDINMVTVNGEVYSQIGVHLKAVSPAAKTMMVTLAAGPDARSGYIYSDAATDHLTFQVIGSRLKPGCAEAGIVASGSAQIRALN